MGAVVSATRLLSVIPAEPVPAKAGSRNPVRGPKRAGRTWTPAFAGVTRGFSAGLSMEKEPEHHAGQTQRKPTLPAELSGVLALRAATR